MSGKQLRKFVGWAAFYVALPILVYPAAALMAAFSGKSFTLEDALVKGDMLFLVIILLATVIDWMILDFMLTPSDEAERRWYDYLYFAVALIALLFYAMIYGWLLNARLPGAPALPNPDLVTKFNGLSVLAVVTLCAVLYYRLLKFNRI